MVTDAANALEDWFQYLNQEDFEYLIQYIENIKNGIPNDKMIILFGYGCNGKSTLIDEINSHLGDELCGHEWDVSELICHENIKPLIFIHEGLLDRTNHNYKRNLNLAHSLKHLIKLGISFIIAVNRLDLINTKILEHSRIIEMIHRFTPNA
jgi:tRNA uridine 5-carbamoylmethylation protein Kti12